MNEQPPEKYWETYCGKDYPDSLQYKQALKAITANTVVHNRLLLMKTYLIGPMDRVPDRGVEWREDLTPWLESRGLIVLDPCDKPVSNGLGSETGEIIEQRNQYMEDGNFDAVRDMMEPVRHVDLRMVDKSDFLIANFDTDIHMCGTHEENTIANCQKKPVIVHCPRGKKNMPPWMFAKLPHELFFETWDEVKAYLDHINSAPDNEIVDFDRWVFFDLEEKTRKALRNVRGH